MSENSLIENVESGGELLINPANPMPIFQVPFCAIGPDKEPAGAGKKADGYTLSYRGYEEMWIYLNSQKGRGMEMT